MKVCSNGTCKHGRDPQPLKSFAKASKPKKDGTTRHNSHCKSCCSMAQSKRISNKRAEARADKAPRKNQHIQRNCVECGDEVSRYAERCIKCRGKKEYFNANSSVNPRFTEPRGSKMRKTLGLEPTNFEGNRCCNITNEV